ncbi:MAG TPA: UpxY family transcription antiterminator [Nitrospira sp.]|nr:UpxY family transcription antiterminator [Nitrospira sp.]
MVIPRWYAIYTYPRAEKAVSSHLRLRGVESFLPLYSKVSRWKNGVKAKVDLPLFPGYLFVRIKLVDRLKVLQTPSVAAIVGRGTQPAAVPDQDVEILKAQLPQISAQPHPFMSVGDMVRVRSGPLEGLEGYLIQKKNQTRFVLSMDLIMQAISVEIDPCDLEALLPGLRN